MMSIMHGKLSGQNNRVCLCWPCGIICSPLTKVMSSKFLDSFKSSFLTTKSPDNQKSIININMNQPSLLLSQGHSSGISIYTKSSGESTIESVRRKDFSVINLCQKSWSLNLVNITASCQYYKYLMINTPSQSEVPSPLYL